MVSDVQTLQVNLAGIIIIQSWTRSQTTMKKKQDVVDACITLQIWTRDQSEIQRKREMEVACALSREKKLKLTCSNLK